MIAIINEDFTGQEKEELFQFIHKVVNKKVAANAVINLTSILMNANYHEFVIMAVVFFFKKVKNMEVTATQSN